MVSFIGWFKEIALDKPLKNQEEANDYFQLRVEEKLSEYLPKKGINDALYCTTRQAIDTIVENTTRWEGTKKVERDSNLELELTLNASFAGDIVLDGEADDDGVLQKSSDNYAVEMWFGDTRHIFMNGFIEKRKTGRPHDPNRPSYLQAVLTVEKGVDVTNYLIDFFGDIDYQWFPVKTSPKRKMTENEFNEDMKAHSLAVIAGLKEKGYNIRAGKYEGISTGESFGDVYVRD